MILNAIVNRVYNVIGGTQSSEDIVNILISITDHCDKHKLSTRERLELFALVCEGVQHAHRKAIIHRDLKPSNILVGEVDGRAVPKIIDFGIAKALGGKLTAGGTIFTRAGALVGTPEYMSPEQAASAGEDIDTRTDVYSLGIIFYELLAGAPPIELSKVALEEFLRRLREEDPPKPSTKITSQNPATSSEVARNRRTEPQVLARQLRGELDSIALKALEKERSRRYASVSEFSADIKRYLNNEAVMAVPPTMVYRARKIARRYRVALLAAMVVVAVLVLATVLSIRQSIRANREAAVAEAVNDFLQKDLLAQASAATQSAPDIKPDPHLEVRTALDRAAQRIEGKFSSQPEVEAAIRSTIGQTYTDLGLYPEARKQLERAVDLRRHVLGVEHPDTLMSMSNLAVVYEGEGKYAEAEALLTEALEVQRRVLGAEHRDTLQSMLILANVYVDEGKQVDGIDKQILDIRRRTLGPEHPETLKAMNSLSADYVAEGKYTEAEALETKVLEVRSRVLGPEHPDTLKAMNNLAVDYWGEGKYAEAEALHSQTLEIQRRVLGPEHPVIIRAMVNLADDYRAEGKYVKAESLLGQALQISRRVLGSQHPTTLWSMQYLANLYEAEGKYEQAESLNKQTLEIRHNVLGAEHRDTLMSMNKLAGIYADEKKYALAETVYLHTLEIRRRVLGAEHSQTLETLSDIAFLYQREGKYVLAGDYAAQALAGQRRTFGAESPDTIATSVADLALADLSLGKFLESEPLAREALEYNQKNQPEQWQRFRAETLVGASLAGQKRYTEAEPLLLSGCQGMTARKDRMDVPDLYHLERAHEWIVQLYRAWGKPEKVVEWTKK